MAAQVGMDLTPETVGNAFVSQYYIVMHRSPEMVQRFYHDSSTMTRPGPDGNLITVTCTKEINNLILSLDAKDFKTEILTADTQASYEGGVIVLVTGCLTGSDNVRRKFTEMFFLAPQGKGLGTSDKVYYVRNNAFRFIEDDSVLSSKTVEDDNVVDSSPAAPLTPVHEPVKVSENSVQDHASTTEVSTENGGGVSVVTTDEQKSTAKEAAVPEAAVPEAAVESTQKPQPVVEASSNGHVDTPKKSYASLLTSSPGTTASASLVRVAASPAKVTKPAATQQSATSPTTHQRQIDGVAAHASKSAVSNGRNGSASGRGLIDEKGHSIYVGNLPSNSTPALIEKEFKQFGRIKKNGVQVRSNRVRAEKEYCFGFVEYEEASGKQKALEEQYIIIDGKKAFIEEKQTSTRVVNGVSFNPSGRGNFSDDGFRGHENYSNGRGYPRNDYSKQNGEGNYSKQHNGDGNFSKHNGEGNYSKRNGDGNYSKRNGEGNYSKQNGEGNYSKYNGEVSSRGNRNGDGYQNGGGRGARQAIPAK